MTQQFSGNFLDSSCLCPSALSVCLLWPFVDFGMVQRQRSSSSLDAPCLFSKARCDKKLQFHSFSAVYSDSIVRKPTLPPLPVKTAEAG